MWSVIWHVICTGGIRDALLQGRVERKLILFLVIPGRGCLGSNMEADFGVLQVFMYRRAQGCSKSLIGIEDI